MTEGGTSGIADRARNDRMTGIVDKERLTRMQGLLRDYGIAMTKRQIAMDQNGDFTLNLTPKAAAQLWRGGLINESQLGAVANGGSARLSFAHNDLLVSSATQSQRSARNDTSTRFEAGKQSGPDTVEHFLGGGKEGHAVMANWLRGGFEMDRRGNWRLKPQVADTLERDVQAIMAQTGWTRSIDRSAQDQIAMGTDVGASISASATRSGFGRATGGKRKPTGSSTTGGASATLGFQSTDRGITTESANANIDIVNYDVREAIAAAESAAARSGNPSETFSRELSKHVLGGRGLRNLYLEQSDSGRGTADVTGPLTSMEQSSVLRTGRFSDDLEKGPLDGDPSFKERRDK
jgi:conjugal transfer mating pair stabilization protein TraG